MLKHTADTCAKYSNAELDVRTCLLKAASEGADVDKSSSVTPSPDCQRALTRYKVCVGVHFDFCTSSYSALCIASNRGQSEMVELLLSHGADQKFFKEVCPLSLAARSCHIEILNMLSRTIPLYGKRALIFALKGDYQLFMGCVYINPRRSFCIRFLIEHGAPIHDIDDEDILQHLWRKIVENGNNPTVNVHNAVKTFISHKLTLTALATKQYRAFSHVIRHTNHQVLLLLFNSGIFELRYSKQNEISRLPANPTMKKDCKILVRQITSMQSRDSTSQREQRRLKTTLSLLRTFYEPWIGHNAFGGEFLDDGDMKVLTLSNLCRWTIRSEIATIYGYISSEHIAKLGVPKPIQRYLWYFLAE